jgi:S-adenosylmethionine hydrolase
VASFRCLTFLTDYGLEDGFTAACHGVAAQIAPQIPMVDITHLVPSGDVRRGAAVLAQTIPYFPPAVHVAVVDPGVGTERRGIALAAGDAILVGPDNGLLSWAASVAGGPRLAVSLTNKEMWLDAEASPTFHGRDIFMPVAARLAAGADLASAGTEVEIDDLVTLPPPASRVHDGTAEGEVLTVDTFGNVQLSISASDASSIGVRYGRSVVIHCGRRQLTVPYRETFGSVAPGELVVFADGSGMVSIAVNSGDAAQRLGLPPGAHVSVSPVP